jgi:acetoin utilization deacetylase AcuC-like enzyme
VHGDPREFYPYFAGALDERGGERAPGTTVNVPLPRGTDGPEYLRALDREALPAIRAFAPAAIVVSAGFDAFERDPIGGFALTVPDFAAIGARLGALGVPVVAVQEGGYCVDALGELAVAFLRGLARRA